MSTPSLSDRSWQPVSTLAGVQAGGTVQTRASLRAYYDDGMNEHYKGAFRLERWNQDPIRYRIAYDGFDANTNINEAGTIDLPLTQWNLTFTKGRSENMEGRIIIIVFNGNDTKRALEKIQLTIPTQYGGHRAAKLVFEAFNAANLELLNGATLVGNRVD